MNALDSLPANRDDIVRFLQKLIRFNTTFPETGQKPIAEKECQDFIAKHLVQLGAEVDVWEPDVERLRSFPNFKVGREFRDRPIVVGKFAGSGGGRSLILNFHIDVVAAHSEDGWTFDPFSGTVANGNVYGRGAADMKGGATAILKAMDAIKQAGIKLRGDVIVESVTDEEIGGMGTLACIERGYRADAAIFAEPTELSVYSAMKGNLEASILVEGRQGWPFGDVGGTVSHWTKGGPVNAIDKALLVIRALKELEAEWQSRPDKVHKLLSTPKINLTTIHGGEWNVIPSKCELKFLTTYLPGNKDENGRGSLVKKEIEEQISTACMLDSWMRQHIPKIEWMIDCPGTDLAMNHPLVGTLVRSATELGMETKVTGLDASDDVSILANQGGVPGIEFGPGSNSQAHAIDEFVPVNELVQATRIMARTICNWCVVS